MNGSYLLFLEIDGVETFIRARMSIVSSQRGEYVKISFSEKYGNKKSSQEYYDILDRLNQEISKNRYKKEIYGLNEFLFYTEEIGDISIQKEYDEVNKRFFQYD
jgi:hypothetical protein